MNSVHQVAPVYPDEAKRARVVGKVDLGVTVEETAKCRWLKW